MRARIAQGLLSSTIIISIASISPTRAFASNPRPQTRYHLAQNLPTTMSASILLSHQSSPLASPVVTEKREVPVLPSAAFVATLAATAIASVTILPLTILYQVGKLVLSPLLPKRSVPSLDSGYNVEASQIVPRSQRKYDMVVLGATGFTGRLAVRHLAKTYSNGVDNKNQKSVKWAIAGRSQAKLDQVKEELAKELNMDEIRDIDCIIVDTSVPASLPALVSQTRVVATTAGPYSLYGSHVVEFCAKFGTHYVDITGEVDWVKTMLLKWQDTARKTGAKLVPFCGHDSIPWDVSVMMMQDIMKKECNDDLEKATFWDQAIGGAPGGTFATVLNGIDGGIVQPPPVEVDAFSRRPDGSKSQYQAHADLPLTISKTKSPWDGKESKRWSIPFIMAPVNAQVVRWSHALRSQGSYSLTYRETFLMPDFKSAFVSYMGLNIFGVALLNPLTRRLVHKMIPAPGQGPAMDVMEDLHYLCVYGEGVGSKGNRVESIFYLPKDAGCLETSRMLVESGLCLALQEDDLPEPEGGFWTPSTALGNVLMKRLLDTGTTWSARVVPSEKTPAQ